MSLEVMLDLNVGWLDWIRWEIMLCIVGDKIRELHVKKAGDGFGGNAGFECERVVLGDVGVCALNNGKCKIKELSVGKARDEFGSYAGFECERVELGKAGSSVLSNGKHKIKE